MGTGQIVVVIAVELVVQIVVVVLPHRARGKEGGAETRERTGPVCVHAGRARRV
jgi:hypothetical protein